MNPKLPAHSSKFLLIASAVLLTACGGGTDGTSGAGMFSSSTTVAGTDNGSNAATAGNATPSASASSTTDKFRAQIYSVTDSPAGSEGPAGQDAAAYALTFHESFDGDLDRNAWNTERTGGDNAVTNYGNSDGSLKIWAERGKNGEFFDRTLDTEGHFSQQYGYFEIEAKLPKGKGVWPAFWLFNQFGERRPEIDILEAYPGGETPWSAAGADGVPVATMYAPVVWNSAGDRAGYGKIATPDLSAGFHKYGVKWEPNRVTFYFDGEERHSIEASISDPLYVILDLWYGSASGTPDGSTPTGTANAFEVNYVKAWQFR